MDPWIAFVLTLLSPALLGILAWFLLEWRKLSGAGPEVRRLRQELGDLRRDYQQLKADHNDMLLGLTATVRRLEERLDHQAGIEPRPADASPSPPVERQL